MGALGEREGQAVLEPAHVDGQGAPDGARHGHQLPSPVHQGPCALCPLLNGGRHWGWGEKKGAVRGSTEALWGGQGFLPRRVWRQCLDFCPIHPGKE